MKKIHFGHYAFVIVALAVLAATLYRIATAPERIKKRIDTAQAVCAAKGGTWKIVDRDEVCDRP